MDNLTTKHVAKFAAPLESTWPDSPISLKHKVKTFDKHGNPVCGIVKWIGKNEGISTLGIEVVSLTIENRTYIKSLMMYSDLHHILVH